MYAYISTPTDNRVIRVADGDTPEGHLDRNSQGRHRQYGAHCSSPVPPRWSCMTGDAGNPAMANDPASLAGKVIRIEQPTTLQPGTADHGAERHRRRRWHVHRPGRRLAVSSPTARRPPTGCSESPRTPRSPRCGRWPDRPGVAGCSALDGTVLVNLVNTKQTVAIHLAQGTGAVTGQPDVVRQDTHGHAWALRMSPDGNIWGDTINKTERRRPETGRRGVPAVPAGRRFPAGQRRQDLAPAMSELRARFTVGARASRYLVRDFAASARNCLTRRAHQRRVLQAGQMRHTVEDLNRCVGMASAMSIASRGGKVASSAPPTTSTGVRMRPSNSRWSGRRGTTLFTAHEAEAMLTDVTVALTCATTSGRCRMRGGPQKSLQHRPTQQRPDSARATWPPGARSRIRPSDGGRRGRRCSSSAPLPRPGPGYVAAKVAPIIPPHELPTKCAFGRGRDHRGCRPRSGRSRRS